MTRDYLSFLWHAGLISHHRCLALLYMYITQLDLVQSPSRQLHTSHDVCMCHRTATHIRVCTVKKLNSWLDTIYLSVYIDSKLELLPDLNPCAKHPYTSP